MSVLLMMDPTMILLKLELNTEGLTADYVSNPNTIDKG